MADTCSDLASAIKRLEVAINKQNQCCEENKKEINKLKDRIAKLEKGGSIELGKDGKVDLTSITQRIARLESYCTSLEDVFSKLKITFKEVFESLDFVTSLVTGIFKQ
ncbi:hypothetical protein I8752_21075 [Nostocaceae cyanobacterium CENA369]|uniref:Uncharacterized protein n=1 Tax=Dendronalium phyllosphericum CENA369 TaxID=1725256 RepID=A0A8J7LFP9_9NOST|nr:hypothetical protein [Dendronalium phyllosphericum]MBH8575456.1 hypothetical protein [Dendronalium phyllosphericum CENA369]